MPRSMLCAAMLSLAMLFGCAHQQPEAEEQDMAWAQGEDPATAATETEAGFRIRLHRPARIGDAYEAHWVHMDTMIVSAADARKQGATRSDESVTKSELTARVDVVDIDANANPIAISITVNKFTGRQNKDLVEAGKIIDVKRTPDNVTFTLRSGERLSDEARSALGYYYGKKSSISHEDTLLGSKIRRKAGESWPIDSVAAAKQLSNDKISVDPKDMSGQTTLAAAEMLHDIKTLRIEGAASARINLKGAPLGFHCDQADINVSVKTLVPMDPALPFIERERNMSLRADFAGSILFIPIKMTMIMHQTETMTPISQP